MHALSHLPAVSERLTDSWLEMRLNHLLGQPAEPNWVNKAFTTKSKLRWASIIGMSLPLKRKCPVCLVNVTGGDILLSSTVQGVGAVQPPSPICKISHGPSLDI